MSECPAAQPERASRRSWPILLITSAWILVTALTHLGSRSPYSYGWAIFGKQSVRMNGMVVNPDARLMPGPTNLFYAGETPYWETSGSQNMRLPAYPFVTSIIAGLTRSSLFSNLAANLFFAFLTAAMALRLARRFEIPGPPALVALLAFFSLPMYVEYLGQPMHYVVGIAAALLTFLVVLALPPDQARGPVVAGFLTAFLSLQYDPWVWVGAVLIYFLVVSRFATLRDYAVYLVVAAVPRLVWEWALQFFSEGAISTHLHTTHVEPVLKVWSQFAADPLSNPMMPVVAAQVGVEVALRQIAVMVYWPILLFCLLGMVRFGPDRPIPRRVWAVLLLPAVYLAEQMFVAAYDWELNPRRAVPVALACGIAFAWVAGRGWRHPGWRTAACAVALFSCFLAMSDTLLENPVMAYVRTGQAMHRNPQEAVKIAEMRLEPGSMPQMMRDEPVNWRDLERVRIRGGGRRRTLFAFVQLYMVMLVTGAVVVARRAQLVPSWAPWVFVLAWGASLAARFL